MAKNYNKCKHFFYLAFKEKDFGQNLNIFFLPKMQKSVGIAPSTGHNWAVLAPRDRVSYMIQGLTFQTWSRGV